LTEPVRHLAAHKQALASRRFHLEKDTPASEGKVDGVQRRHPHSLSQAEETGKRRRLVVPHTQQTTTLRRNRHTIQINAHVRHVRKRTRQDALEGTPHTTVLGIEDPGESGAGEDACPTTRVERELGQRSKRA
jgi:hypothetical protein